MKNFLKLLRFLKPYKKWALLAPVLVILEVIMDLFNPVIIANVINIGITNNDIGYILINIGLMLLLTLLGVIGGLGSAYYATKSSQYSDADIRKEIMTKISDLSFLNLDKIKAGHLITIITNDITLIGNVIMMGLRLVVRVPIIVIGSVIMSIIISPKLSMILLVVIPLMLIFVAIIMKKAFPLFKSMQERLDDVNVTIRENLGGIRVVKSFVNEEYEMNKFNSVNKNLRDTTIKAVRLLMLALPLVMLLINLAVVFVLWYGGIDVINGNMKIGNIVAFIQYLTNILSSITIAAMVIVMLSRSEASALRINEILELSNDFKKEDNAITIDKMKGKIEFKNVTFNYIGGSGDAVLKNINFTINPGELVVIMGSTGSGKSTLINLIPRFYDTVDGEVLIDDIDVKKYDIDFLRNQIGLAFQQPFIFSDTIKNNIKYGNENATDEEIIEASKIALAHDFIVRKKDKYDHVLEQKGANLSGGQKQRICIARALINKPAIIILDDVTSAVDMKTEKNIRHNIKNKLEGKTIVAIASRISLAMEADKVIVIDDGIIKGIGTHQELLESNEIYKEIYASQIKDGELDD